MNRSPARLVHNNMLQQASTIDAQLLVRKCVACGYDGDLLRKGQAPRCARCGCDLKKRPARSYAEMEGLISQTFTIEPPLSNLPQERRFGHRWIVFLFVAAICIIALIQLTSATFDI